MKDYTEYAFAAIFGAEVEIKTTENSPFEGGVVKGKVISSTDSQVFLELEIEQRLIFVLREHILSLSAYITPRKMTLKQLHSYYKSLAKRDCYEDYVVIIRGGEVEEPSNRITYSLKRMDAEDIEEFGPWTNDVDEPLDDYIDCTEWGWKHE